ncbi:MAG: glycosyltransferase family 4 protein [Solirubrobacterales bacterium]
MRILIFHGYLLRGTGSNVYNASLARTLSALGHQVHLLCQDRRACELDWVNRVGEWEGGELRVRDVRPGAGRGSVSVYTPDIGGLLPVYVADTYEGFEVKTFPELSEAELDRYLAANVAAVRDVDAAAGGAEAALANHLVMGPVILARAGLRFALKVHGSDLSYTVLPHPRFVPYAEEGVAAASAALVGSGYTAEDLWRALPDPGVRERTRLGPPGVDVRAFRRRDPGQATAALRELAEVLREIPADLEGGAFGRDPAEGARALEWFAAAEGPRVLFVGKLIANKGVDLLVAAWPLVAREHPGARLLLVGFGALREGLEQLLGSLGAGDLETARRLAARGRALEGGEPGGLPILSGFLADPPPGYAEAAAAAAGSIEISGRLEHSEVAELMPAVEALAMPSTFPEAFGMVAVEAAACGALPISADHSGMREVSQRLGESVAPEIARLLSFEVGPGAIDQIAERLLAWLALSDAERQAIGAQLATRAAELWSWEKVAEGVIAASQGQLDRLPKVTDSQGEGAGRPSE